MPRAVLKKGRIHPVEPLPPDWQDGVELRIEKSSAASERRAGRSTDEWMDGVERLAAKIPGKEDEELEAAIRKIRQQAKALAR
jgi:hypothetical protein